MDNITLFIFGGVSSIASEASTARDDFLVAVVGPLSSMVLAGAFSLIAQLGSPDTAVVVPANYVAFANLALGIFNLVPGYPLDGGRVLRSIVWAVTGDAARATRIAASSALLTRSTSVSRRGQRRQSTKS